MTITLNLFVLQLLTVSLYDTLQYIFSRLQLQT